MLVEPTGSPDTILVCIRGDSGSGKSSIARDLRRQHGRGCALVEQDYLRHILLRERSPPVPSPTSSLHRSTCCGSACTLTAWPGESSTCLSGAPTCSTGCAGRP